MRIEKRWLEFTDVRAVLENGVRKVGGYAAVFNKLSQVLYNFKEKIAPGAFKRTLEENDVVALWSHNTDVVLGRKGSGTLSLREDNKGLAFELLLPESPWGQNAYTAIERGDVNGMSFGFITRRDEWERNNDGKPHIRTLLDVDLLEVSPTAFPAYKQTQVGTRSESDGTPEEVARAQEKKWAYEDKEKQETAISPTQSVNALRQRLAELE